MEWRRPTYQTIEYFAHAWLSWDDSKEATLTLSNSQRQLASNAHELEEVTSFIQHILHDRYMKKILTQVSNTSLMFNMNHGGDKMLLMGSIATHRNFHITGLPPLCSQCDSICHTKRCNGVCSRDQPRVRQHYDYHWFLFDLTIAHAQIKDWIR